MRNYDLGENMYVFHASRRGNTDKFVCWQGKVLHLGTKTEFMELVSPPRRC